MNWYYKYFSFSNFILLIIGGRVFHPYVSLLFPAIAVILILLPFKKYCKQLSLISLMIGLGTINSGYYKTKIEFHKIVTEIMNDQSVKGKGIIEKVSQISKGYKIEISEISIYDTRVPDGLTTNYFNSKNVPEVGSKIQFQGNFQLYQEQRNPGGVDWYKKNLERGLLGKIFVDEFNFHEEENTSFKLKGLIQNSHKILQNVIFDNSDEHTGGLILALLVGNRKYVDPDLTRNFINSGVIHVMALSGLHVGYIIIILVFMTRSLSIPWGYDKLFIILGLFAFILITGAKASVVRAVLMASTYLIAGMCKTINNKWNSLGVAGIVILLFDPGAINEAGFIFSFTAVSSIFLFYPYFTNLKIFQKILSIDSILVKYTLQLFLVSLSAQIGTTPITLMVFHKISLIGYISNLFIVPLIGIFVSISFLFLAFFWVPFISEALSNTLWGIYYLLDQLTIWFSNIAYSNLYPGYVSEYIAASILISITLFIITKEYFKPTLIIIPLNVLSLIIGHIVYKESPSDVIFLDVGQGDAIVLKNSNGSILVDTGPGNFNWDAGSQIIVPTLNYLGINKLNNVVLTHGHADHTGGFGGLLKGITIDTLIYNGDKKWIHELVEAKGIPVKKIFSGGQIEDLQVLHPQKDDLLKIRNLNNRSIIIRTDRMPGGLILTGDLELSGFRSLFSNYDQLKTKYLKISHHGSYTGTNETVLNKLAPKTAIISVGERNKFRHPSRSVIDLLKENMVEIKRTDRSGAIWYKVKNDSAWEHKWKF